MEKKDKETIERLYKNLNDLTDEAATTQEIIDGIKEGLDETDADYISLHSAGNHLDMVITHLEESNKQLLDIK